MSTAAAGVVSGQTGTRWIPVIGLEVHCQLDTRTKLFCGCEYSFGAEPNTITCPVCTAQPGALPVLNSAALEYAVRAALALNADVAPVSKFDRKNYFYCDLPKGYQISQFDLPYCTGGGIQLASGKFIRLTRIHMEEDAGKAIHDRGDATLVDLNRAGVPLIESVTEADMCSADEAHEYLTALKEIFQYIGVSDCDMEKGSLRCDVNVSVHPEGEPWRTKVEVKNLNSFRNVRASIQYEIARQIEAYETGDPAQYPEQETRLFDVAAGVTRTMRSKEDAHDYRYFPDPDLPLVTVDAVLIERQRGLLPELPVARRARYESELGLSAYDAGVMTAARDVADFFETVVRVGGDPKAAANWIANDVLRALSDPDVAASSILELLVKPNDLAELIALVGDGTVSKNAGREVLDEMLRSGARAKDVVQAMGLEQVQDTSQIDEWCRAALAGREATVADVRAGNLKAIGALMGPVMQASKGSADPQLVRAALLRIIGEEG